MLQILITAGLPRDFTINLKRVLTWLLRTGVYCD